MQYLARAVPAGRLEADASHALHDNSASSTARFPIETGAGFSGAFVGPGDAIPVEASSFTLIVNEHFMFAVITALSSELLKVGGLAAEATIRRSVPGGLAASIDRKLLEPDPRRRRRLGGPPRIKQTGPMKGATPDIMPLA